MFDDLCDCVWFGGFSSHIGGDRTKKKFAKQREQFYHQSFIIPSSSSSSKTLL
jgi:hypothetical protein